MKLLRIALIGILAFILHSCVSLDTTSYSDPDFIGKNYDYFCIYSIEDDLVLRSKIEEAFVDVFQKNNTSAIAGSELFPPTRDWKEEDFQKGLSKRNIDAFLKIELIDQSISQTSSPRASTTTRTRENEDEDGDKESETVTNTVFTEDITTVQNNTFKAQLIDVKSNRIAWTATGNTSANLDFSTLQDIIEKFAEGILEQLRKKRHI